MFNVTSHCENANQSCQKKILPYTQLDGHYQKHRDKCWGGCRETETLMHCRWEWKMEQLLWKMVRRFLKKKKKLNKNYHVSSNSTAGYLPKRHESKLQTNTCTLIFIAAVSTTAKKWKKPWLTANE